MGEDADTQIQPGSHESDTWLQRRRKLESRERLAKCRSQWSLAATNPFGVVTSIVSLQQICTREKKKRESMAREGWEWGGRRGYYTVDNTDTTTSWRCPKESCFWSGAGMAYLWLKAGRGGDRHMRWLIQGVSAPLLMSCILAAPKQ